MAERSGKKCEMRTAVMARARRPSRAGKKRGGPGFGGGPAAGSWGGELEEGRFKAVSKAVPGATRNRAEPRGGRERTHPAYVNERFDPGSRAILPLVPWNQERP